jgi:hypothetical protein
MSSDELIEDFLDNLGSMDPYWQKLEWNKLREDNPDLYDKVIEYKKAQDSP